MFSELFHGTILGTIITDRAIVAGEDHEGVVHQLETVERVEHGTERGVHLLDDIATRAELGFANETRMRHAGHVNVMRGEVEKERPVLLLLDEVHGFLRERVGHVLVIPARSLAAGHPADAAHAVHDGVIVAAAGVHLEQVGILFAGGLVADLVVVADLNRIFRIQSRDTAVLDIDARHAVAGGRKDEGIVKTDLVRTGLDVAIPIELPLIAETEMPFANGGRGIACLLKQ